MTAEMRAALLQSREQLAAGVRRAPADKEPASPPAVTVTDSASSTGGGVVQRRAAALAASPALQQAPDLTVADLVEGLDAIEEETRRKMRLAYNARSKVCAGGRERCRLVAPLMMPCWHRLP